MRKILLAVLLLQSFASLCSFAQSDFDYLHWVFFDNSATPRSYYYSVASASAPSTLHIIDGKLPVEHKVFLSPPNSLELAFLSAKEGGWSAEIDLSALRGRPVERPGKELSLWIYPQEAVSAEAFPLLSLAGEHRQYTAPLDIAKFVRNLKPKSWNRVRIPFNAFTSIAPDEFRDDGLSAVIFSQHGADGASHTLYIDDIRVEGTADAKHPLVAPKILDAKGYERHIDIRWDATKPGENQDAVETVVYRSMNGKEFEPVGIQRPGVTRYCDYIGDPHATATYKVAVRAADQRESAKSGPVTASTHPMSDDELLDMVEEASIRYYWEANEPNSGMALESTPRQDDMIALGASGFGVMSMIVGAERGFLPREDVVDRLNRITKFLERADRYKGAWPHFINGKTGHVWVLFQIYDDGADLVETSFLMQGLLTAREYFDRDTPKEKELRDRITELWRGIDWDWFRATKNRDALWWHWSPNYAFQISNRLEGWNETMITYMLAIASPTHGSPPGIYFSGFCAEGDTNPDHPYGGKHTYYGITMPMIYSHDSPGPMFFTEYSYMGFDPRGWHDKYANYFDNNRNEALISRQYSIANPQHYAGYGENSWGLTAVDGPLKYEEYKPFDTDDGTIAPTGAVSAYAYTPKETMALIRHYYRDLGDVTWDIYGFRDAFNQQEDWAATLTMGLNQAPQAVMIENGRTGLIWKYFMKNPEITRAMDAIGLVREKK